MSVRIAMISYLNTLPFAYGLENSLLIDRESFSLIYCTPAEAAEKLSNNEVDLGIVPVATIPSIENHKVISDFCIGATSKVASVLLCSSKKFEEIDVLYLDMESRTSIILGRLLCENYWHITPEFVNFNYRAEPIDSNNSYILIGDKALANASKFAFTYDLAEEWRAYRNEPFVFACWTANKELDDNFIKQFNSALAYGVSHIEEAVKASSVRNDFTREQAINYLKYNISYDFDEQKKEALRDFWSLASAILRSRFR